MPETKRRWSIALAFIVVSEAGEATVGEHRARVPPTRRHSNDGPQVRRHLALALLVVPEAGEATIREHRARVLHTRRHSNDRPQIHWHVALPFPVVPEADEATRRSELLTFSINRTVYWSRGRIARETPSEPQAGGDDQEVSLVNKFNPKGNPQSRILV